MRNTWLELYTQCLDEGFTGEEARREADERYADQQAAEADHAADRHKERIAVAKAAGEGQ